MLYIDIDEFKGINDSLGHPVGDELLKGSRAAAARLRARPDLVARLGGDEFAIVQTGVESHADVIDLVGRIYDAIRQPFDCLGHSLLTDASIGIALAPRDGADLDYAAEERRPCDVRRQGRRPPYLPLLRARNGCAGAGPPPAGA